MLDHLKQDSVAAQRYLSASEAAVYCHVTTERLAQLAREGYMGRRIAGRWLYTDAELDRYLQERKGQRRRHKLVHEGQQ